MRQLFVLMVAAVIACPHVHAAAQAPAPQAKANDDARAAFLRKCVRDLTKRSCTAPPEARAGK